MARTAHEAGEPDSVTMTIHNMSILRSCGVGLIAVATVAATTVRAETPGEWIALGARVHGGFGSFIPVGIRIGLNALQALNAKPREVTVVYYDSDKAPCACIADGVAIATLASVGQRTLQMAPEKAPDGSLAAVVVRHKQTGKTVKYTVAESWLPKLAEWNRTLDAQGRFDQVMNTERLFDEAPVK
jgi:formylmethanofuran dehydrogenase subunit E